ncbi:hypothetical protein IFM89_010383 [Coptis chinensis]|uniref:Uncharacterized protein n=1 Tax=Coptis chinensis TaxID=261450 RepID=A0A835IXC3_9MAGN|nr:hypothetical protein IFM89_010383 [Coptis chinensis]
MRFLKRIAGIFGLLKDERELESEESGDTHDREIKEELPLPLPRGQRKGFSVQVPVHNQLGPLLTPSNNLNDGGVQGLRWYARRLRIDEDGDVADEFLDEIVPEVVEMPSNMDDQRPVSKFEVKYRTRPAKVRKQVISIDGKLQQSVEYQGRLQFV